MLSGASSPKASQEGMSLAEWKAYDNEQLARYERIQQADLAFDAEVGELTLDEWYQIEPRAVALHIEQVQQQARDTCADPNKSPLDCIQAWEQANQTIEGITREAASRPQVPYTSNPSPGPGQAEA